MDQFGGGSEDDAIVHAFYRVGQLGQVAVVTTALVSKVNEEPLSVGAVNRVDDLRMAPDREIVTAIFFDRLVVERDDDDVPDTGRQATRPTAASIMRSTGSAIDDRPAATLSNSASAIVRQLMKRLLTLTGTHGSPK